MKLSLSGRILEGRKASIEELAGLASRIGYSAVEVRYYLLNSGCTEEQARHIGKVLSDHKLACAFLTADGFEDSGGIEKLRKLLALARLVDCRLIRVHFRDVDHQLRSAQQASDLAARDGATLVQQIHTGTPFETIAGALGSVKKIARPNFRLTFEPANLLLAGERHGKDSIKRLGPAIGNVCVQNLKEVPSRAADSLEYKGRFFVRCLVDDPQSIDYRSVFEGLQEIGYDGYVTLLDPETSLMKAEDFAADAYRKLVRYL